MNKFSNQDFAALFVQQDSGLLLALLLDYLNIEPKRLTDTQAQAWWDAQSLFKAVLQARLEGMPMEQVVQGWNSFAPAELVLGTRKQFDEVLDGIEAEHGPLPKRAVS